jgi:hypothetical protein
MEKDAKMHAHLNHRHAHARIGSLTAMAAVELGTWLAALLMYIN